MIFEIFKPRIMYLRVTSNEMELKDIETGVTIKKKGKIKFSSQRSLIADFDAAEILLRGILTDMDGDGIFQRSIHFLVQPLELLEGGISEVEKRAFRDLSEHAGGRKVYITETVDQLSDDEVIALLER